MNISGESAIKQIDDAFAKHDQALGSGQCDRKFQEAQTLYCVTIERLTQPGSQYREQMKQVFEDPPSAGTVGTDYYGRLEKLRGLLNALSEDYRTGRIGTVKESDVPAFLRLDRLLTRFHQVARELDTRRPTKDSLRIFNEYDVQDLLVALLRIDFDDIRPEEWTPSYAGKSARMDFLLKKEQIVIEAKMTRDGLGAKQLGDQLLVDIARYKGHADCRTLVCFIYDPEQRISNPVGLKHDLESESTQSLAATVYICQH